MSKNELTTTQCKEILNKLKDKADFISIFINNSSSECLEGMFSNKTSSKEFEINKTETNISVEIIHNKRNFSFNCDQIDILESKILENMEKIKEFSKDKEIVIPKSKPIVAQDDNLFFIPEDLNEFYNDIQKIVQSMYKKYVKNIIANIMVKKVFSNKTVVNTNGFEHLYKATFSILMVELITEKDGKKYTVCWSHYIQNMKKAKLYIEKEFQNLADRLDSTSIKGGEYECIIKNRNVSYFFSEFVNLLTGNNIDNGSSYYKNSLQKQVLNSGIDIIENPKCKYGKMSYDNEGTKLKKKFIVKDGILQTFLVNSRYAKKLKYKKTGNAFVGGIYCTHIFLESKERYDEKNFKNGVIITDFIDNNLNDTTGDFKASCCGLLVENGKRTPFNNAVISMNLKDLLKIQIVNDSICEDNNIFTPSIFLPKINIAS